MYDELVKRLREAPGDWPDADLHYEAADAIEELSMRLHGDEAAIAGMKREIEHMVVAGRPRWISVTERLPETARDVLVAFRLPTEKTYLITKTQRASWSEKRKHDAFYQRGVTHWMEMPEPPKEET